MDDLAGIVSELIGKQREGQYWDFKETHHTNNSDLLHDIICMANSYVKHDKYIIYGVRDPAHGCEIVGVNDTTRKTQTDLINFLRDKKFIGGVPPEIELHTLELNGESPLELDVLIIYDNPFKPYVLEESYQGVHANNIYTRTIDNNTPKNKSADIYKQEQLWRERFGLDVEPIKRVLQLMKDNENWENELGSEYPMFYKYHPEYTITASDYREGSEIYNCLCPDTRGHFAQCEVRYAGTLLMTYTIVAVDGFRYYMPAPKISTIGNPANPRDNLFYFSYIDNEISGALRFLISPGLGTSDAYPYLNVLNDVLIIFPSSTEKKRFEEFASNNKVILEGINVDSRFSDIDIGLLENGCPNANAWKFETMAKIKEMHTSWVQRGMPS